MDVAPRAAAEAAALERSAEWERARAAYASAFQTAVAAGDACGTAVAVRGAARVLLDLGRLDEAQELAELSLEIATRAAFPREGARAANVLGAVRFVGGAIHEAAAMYEAALETAREVRDDELIGLACANLGVVANIRGDFRSAFHCYLESIAAAVRTGNVQASVLGYNNLGLLAADMHEWMQADLLFHRALELAEQAEDASVIPMLLLNRAEPLLHVGELDAAEEVLDRAQRLAEGLRNEQELAEVARFRGLLARRRGDDAGAAGHFARSLLLATRAGLRLERAEALEQFALLHHAAGRADDARTHLAEAAAEFFAAGATRDCARCRDRLTAWSAPGDRPADTVPAVRIAGAA